MTGNHQAKRGHSKEKRTDCPLVTLGLVLDGSGFIRRSRVFAGNVSEDSTLAGGWTVIGVGEDVRTIWRQFKDWRYRFMGAELKLVNGQGYILYISGGCRGAARPEPTDQ